jgi:hypothetical protein
MGVYPPFLNHYIMKKTSNFKMPKSLKIMLTGMDKEKRQHYKDKSIAALLEPKIEFKKKRKEETKDE